MHSSTLGLRDEASWQRCGGSRTESTTTQTETAHRTRGVLRIFADAIKMSADLGLQNQLGQALSLCGNPGDVLRLIEEFRHRQQSVSARFPQSCGLSYALSVAFIIARVV